MPFKQFKQENAGGYYTVAAEDLQGGFARKGQRIYGDCDDMIVVNWLYQPLNGIYTVYLKDPA